MALSTMQEILILLEDEKFVPLYRLNRWGRPARGSLAKLKNLDWAKKEKKDGEIFYRITEKGERYFDDTLNILKEKDAWDNKWRLVIFDIPESNRGIRDKLRRALNSMGMGILQGSVWISTSDIKNKIDAIAEKLNLVKNIKYFEVTSSQSLNKQIIEKAWNLPEINLNLEKFIKEGERALKTMGKGNGDRFKAKALIFDYALILKKDPKLPKEFIEQNQIRKDANEIYLKLRDYVV